MRLTDGVKLHPHERDESASSREIAEPNPSAASTILLGVAPRFEDLLGGIRAAFKVLEEHGVGCFGLHIVSYNFEGTPGAKVAIDVVPISTGPV